jgi:hypothetical protein
MIIGTGVRKEFCDRKENAQKLNLDNSNLGSWGDMENSSPQ